MALMLLITMASQAQIHSSTNSRITKTKEKKVVNDTADYNRISLGYSLLYTEKDESGKMFRGGELDYLHGFNLTKNCPFFLELGLRVAFDAYKYTYNNGGEAFFDYRTETTIQRSLLSASIPLSFSYKLTFVNGFYIAPYLGPQLRVNIVGKDKVSETVSENGEELLDEMYNLFDKEETDPAMKRVQFGGQAGLNIGYKRLNMGAGYYFCSPLWKDGSEKMKCNGLSATIGINF